MSFAENSNGFTPSFVSLALSGITHRFILVLECESRQYEGEVAVSHPRFCVGGPRATLDPRNVSITDLLPLGASKVDLPAGWEKVHQLLYVVQQSTDEHGWQYRSQWPQQALEATDELWSNNNATNADVRRRLWMTTVVKRDDVLIAKRKISELIQSRQRGVILRGPLLRLEEDANGDKKWIPRNCSLLDEKIEICDEETGVKIDELLVLGHQIKMLDGYAFSIRRLDGSSCVLFDTDSKETRRRWLIAISYQIAVRGPLIDFHPFPYAPPLGEDTSNRVILCGDLLKKGQTGMNWKSRFFKLTPKELQYFDREALKGSIKIEGCILKTEEKSLEISMKSKNNVSVVMKADNQLNKTTWANAFEAQIQFLASKSTSNARVIAAEELALALAPHELPNYKPGVRSIPIPSVLLKEGESSSQIRSALSGENHPLTSPFNSFKGEGNGFPGGSPVGGVRPGVPQAVSDKEGEDEAGEEDDEEEWKRERERDGDGEGEGEGEGEDDGELREGEDPRDPKVIARIAARRKAEQVNLDNMKRGRNFTLLPYTARPASLKFGIKPEYYVTYNDFGMAPELLTIAQKVAILESAAWDNQSTALQPVAAKQRPSLPGCDSADYTPTGLRLKDAPIKDSIPENDGGAVAKTADTLKSKINAWEGWSKEKIAEKKAAAAAAAEAAKSSK